MANLTELIGHWGYPAIFLAVILGNIGIPVPEEAILMLAGYLVWKGELWLPAVLVIGVLSAVAGDNIGYWIGRRYGQAVIRRYREWLFVTTDKFDSAQRLVTRYGPLGVFCARFLPGLRFMAGPLAGTAGLPFLPFFTANILGAAIYVPVTVVLGLSIGYGLGGYVEKLQTVAGKVEHLVVIAVTLCIVAIVLWRILQARRSSGKGPLSK